MTLRPTGDFAVEHPGGKTTYHRTQAAAFKSAFNAAKNNRAGSQVVVNAVVSGLPKPGHVRATMVGLAVVKRVRGSRDVKIRWLGSLAKKLKPRVLKRDGTF